MNGTLYIVGTPIGNLEDITLRAIRTLKEVSVIAAEDTRRTAILLRHFQIATPMLSCHKFNEARRADEILLRLRAGDSVALVSDSGMPGVSDPGGRLIRAAIEAGLTVDVIPGPTAVTTALTLTGFDSGEFHFIGFLPRKPGAIRKKIATLVDDSATLVFYESPYRVAKTIAVIAETMGDRRVVVARELTKKFQEIIRGRADELATKLSGRKIKGECVILVEGCSGGLQSVR